MLALFIRSTRYGGEQGGTALHWNCSSPPLSLSLRPQFTLCRGLTGRAGVSDQKWPHTISPSVWIGTKSLQRDCNRGCVQLQEEVGRQLFLPGDVPLYRLPPAPVSALSTQPASKTLFATSPARGAAEMHKRQDARKVGRGHGSKFRPCSG